MDAAPDVAVQRVAARPFAAPPPDEPRTSALPGLADRRPVEGWLVGVTDGRTWGWWGPVTQRVARDAEMLDMAVADRAPTTPARWGRRMRRAVRHGHTGAHGVAAGAVELACWDLAGHRTGAPVWALHGDPPGSPPTSYATCFGVDAAADPAVPKSIAAVWPIQKWWGHDGAGALDTARSVAAQFDADDRLALDFGGRWAADAVSRLCAQLDVRLAWVEEPCWPGEMHLVHRGQFPVPHAAGEHCYGPFESAVLVAAGVDVWQPDAVFCGGYDNLRTMTTLATSNGALCAPHGGGFLPAVHAAVAGSPVWLVEYHLRLEPRRQAHLAAGSRPAFEEGSAVVAVPDQPGWGGALRAEIKGGHDE